LDYADAEYLATVLKPFLSPEGSLSPYKPTNSLIIKDRESVVNMLAETIKGEPCIPASQTSKRNHAGVRVDSSTPQILGICR
jgi:type II secretory pathway component GspD/PulD (secretin)